MSTTIEADIEIGPQDGPQTAYFLSEADILIYGGQAGGGKTFAVVADPLRYIDIPGFTGVIFRRTSAQIQGQGTIWDEAMGLYPHRGGRPRESPRMDFRFPSGARIGFSHLQHEKDKTSHQGKAYAYLAFDELTHFTMSQFFYLLSRNRTTCGIRPYCRATCNPDAGSWVAEFIAWWIDQDSGYPIQERSGVLRYMIRDGDKIVWGDSKQELIDQYPDYTPDDILSVTFIPATLDDNPALLKKDPGYRGRLKAQARIDRERLEKGNWKVQEGAIIDSTWLRRYIPINNGRVQLIHHGTLHEFAYSQCRRFATCDTAGTSKEKAAEKRGDPPSWSCCGIWDHYRIANKVARFDFLLLRYIWREQVEWNNLKSLVPELLKAWNVPLVLIENAHYGAPLSSEIKGRSVQLVGPTIEGMDDTSRGAKLERAAASGLLSRLEFSGLYIPQFEVEEQWVRDYVRELTVWTGLPKETADQIDVSSYAAWHVKNTTGGWGGVIQ